MSTSIAKTPATKVNPMKAILYLRVSDPEQTKGYSLDGQEKDCRRFAEHNGINVSRVLREEGESAKTISRTQLQALLKFIEADHREIDALIVWKFDRLARNLEDQLAMIRMFSEHGIRVLSATEINEDTAAGRLNRNVLGAFAQFENEVKAERVVMAMKEAVLGGRWLWKPPIGYCREIGPAGKTILAPSDKAWTIQQVFGRFETAKYKQTEITAFLLASGVKHANSMLTHRILTNPLYCGIIRVPWFPDDIEACHQPLITKDTFSRSKRSCPGDS